MTSPDVPSLPALIDTQRRLVAALQRRELEDRRDRPAAPQALATAIDKLSTLERLAAETRP